MAQSSNPVPEILDLVTYEPMILSLVLADKMISIVYKHTRLVVDNSYIVLLLAEMQNHNAITIKELSWPECPGSVIIIKRVEHGKDLQQS